MLRSLGVALVVATLVLVVAELVLERVVGPPPPALGVRASSMDHPLFLRVREPGFSIDRTALGKTFPFRVNALGFRGPEMAPAKPADTYRIIFIGASVVESAHLPEEETFVRVVEQMLNDRLGGSPRVETGSLAQPGFTSHVSLAQIANRVLELDPDLVIEFDAADWAVPLNPAYEPTLMYMARTSSTRKIPLSEWIATNSQLVRWVTRLTSPKPGFEFDTYLEHARRRRRVTPFRNPPNRLFERGLERFSLNLHRSALLCRDAGVAYAATTQPWLYKPNQPPREDRSLWLSYDNPNIRKGGWNLSPAVARRWVDAYNDVIRDRARSDGFILIDLAARVPRDLDHLIDDVHPTAAGSRVYAEEIVSQLLRDGRLPRVVSRGAPGISQP